MSEPKNTGFFIFILVVAISFSLSGCPSGGGEVLFPIDNGTGGYPVGGTGRTNYAPTANASWDQSVETGTVVYLNGTASYDPDGDLLTYVWSFSSKPDGSSATLSSQFAATPSFVVDKAGSYVLELVVNDGSVSSAADTVTVTATTPYGSTNTTPIANAGPDQSVKTGTLVALDGSSSMDVDYDPLTYNWSILTKPGGSLASISTTNAVYPTFTADRDGSYVIQLIVNDGIVNSISDTVTVTAATPVVMYVPDTGQTGDFTATFGEDSDYAAHPPAYTGGGGTVTDMVTGLVWQQQDDGTVKDWASAMNYCSSLSLGGYDDWRLPDNRELVSIVDYGRSKPAIDTTVFPNTQSSGYWTSTEYGLDATSAWDLLFDDGTNDTSKNGKTNTHYVRCVRGTQSQPVFTDNGNGTVTDETTTLMWQQADDNTMRKWDDAILYCEGLDLAGYTDWRLPNVKEQMSLTDYRFWPFTINHDYFPSTLKQKGTAVPNYHSSTTSVSNGTQTVSEKFLVGLLYSGNKSGALFVRCVRGGL